MSAELTTIHLVGSLGKAMGRSEWHLDVKSPSEAIRAIDINLRGKLREYLEGPARNKWYRIALQKRDNLIDKQELGNRSGRSTIYIMPTIKGRNSGVGKILTGIALIALTLINPLAGTMFSTMTAATATTAAGFTMLGSVVMGFGISLVLGGISQLLTPTPQGPSANPEQAQSTSFPGNAGAVVQGGCIPVVYGRALVSPIPVAVTTTNNDVSTTAAGTLGGSRTTDLEGGGVQNDPVSVVTVVCDVSILSRNVNSTYNTYDSIRDVTVGAVVTGPGIQPHTTVTYVEAAGPVWYFGISNDPTANGTGVTLTITALT